jgi:putative peptidoglycan lipid II flippase
MLPNLSPIIMSLAIIGVVIAVPNDQKGYALAWATTAGAILQLIIQYPNIRKLGYRLKPVFEFTNNPHFKEIGELLFPAILSSTIGQISIYIDMFFASILVTGAWTSVVFANRIFQFPVGILVTAFLVPLFPIFSRLAGEGNKDSIKVYFNKGVGVLFFAAIPMIMWILLLARDGISLVFERGAFNSDAVLMVSEALCFLSWSIIPYVFRDSITRVYYAFNDSKTPFIVAMSSIALKAVLNWLLIIRLNMGIAGITLSTSFITLFNATMLGLFMRKRIKLDYKTLFINFGKMMLAGVLTFAAGWFICLGFNNVILPKYIFESVKILVVILSCSAIYTVLNILFKMDYAKELIKRLKK